MLTKARTSAFVLGFIVIFNFNVKVAAQVAPAATGDFKNESTVRDPAAQDQVFTPEYMNQINTAQQEKQAKEQEQRERHEKAMDLWLRH